MINQRGSFVWLFATNDTNTKKQKTALTIKEIKPNIVNVPSTKGRGIATSDLPFTLFCMFTSCIATITIKQRLQIKTNFEKNA
jgi:hypothetical protein